MKTPIVRSYGTRVNKGFTLVEIIVVVAIIGILSSIMFASFDDSRKKARDAARQSDLQQLSAAVQVYGTTYGEYPESLDELIDTGLFPSMPTDPINEGEYVYGYENGENCYRISGQSERSEEAIVLGNCPDDN